MLINNNGIIAFCTQPAGQLGNAFNASGTNHHRCFKAAAVFQDNQAFLYGLQVAV